MKISKILRTLGIAVILSLLTALAAIPAYAATGSEDIYVSPSEGEIGDTVDVYGYDFDPGESVRIYFSSEEADEGDYLDDEVNAYEWVETTRAGDMGESDEGEIDIYFTIPDELTDGDNAESVFGGRHYIYATYSGSLRIRAVTILTVTGGAITIDPDEGAVGTEVELSGEEFDDSEDIVVKYDGEELEIQSGDEETNRYGEFENTVVIIPPSTAGDHVITIIGDDSDIQATAFFAVEPEITISPESGAGGTTVTVSGTGFGYKNEFSIFFDGDEVIDDEITDRDGGFEVTFDVPVLGPGTYDVEAEDEDDYYDEVEFSIAASSASISPTSGYVGSEVTVSGTGFKVGKEITIYFAGTEVTTTPASIVTDSKGSFSASFKVPATTAGTYKVEISDGTYKDSANFTISTSASLTSTQGHVGTELKLNGVGFIASGTVTITYDNVKLATVTAKADGTFAATFTVPPSQHGEHIITLTDGTTTQQFIFVMESDAPIVPAPLKPEMGVKAKANAYFDWEDVTDPSGVIYNLQIASDENFTSIVLEKKGLTESEYTITKEERLESVSKKTPYYWQVKAIDGASNESIWSGAGSFYVGFSWPGWIIYIWFVIGALIVGAIGFSLGRKSAYYSY